MTPRSRPARRSALALAVATSLMAGLARADGPPVVCATPEQAKQVEAEYAANPKMPPFMMAPKLGVPESAVAGALPADHSVGTSSAAFHPVWESLQKWDDALTLILKGGQVFEIRGKVHGGEPSKMPGSKNFNLNDDPPGVGGHLRPDLLSAIYAIELPTREGQLRAIAFYDLKGDGAFIVAIPPEGAPPTVQRQFEATRELIRQAPRACAR